MPDFGPIISAADLATLLSADDVTVIDCRFNLADPPAGRRDWLESHIPSASYVDLDRDLSAAKGPATGRHPLPDAESLERVFARAGVEPGGRVVVYDASHGGIAARAWWSLQWLGHEAVALLDGGYAGWVADGYPFESGESGVGPGNFKATGPARPTVTTDEVLAGLSEPGRLRLVDAREAARYRGEHEPIDRKAGRIPGARNLPFTDLVDEAGHFLDAANIRQRLAAVLGEDASRPWTAMCGSGVTACHLALAAEFAGYARPAVYIGSFSEWIQDPDRPVDSG